MAQDIKILSKDERLKKSELLCFARQLIHDHSGGIKFTELCSNMVVLSNGQFMAEDIDRLEEVLRKQKDLKVVTYHWYIDSDHAREKMFVCTR